MAKVKIYQTGTINSLLNAVYEGDVAVKELKTHGDFGLGTFDQLDGEFIACDNEFYRADVNGKLSLVNDNIKSPFAVVNKFIADKEFSVNLCNFQQLEAFLADKFISKNFIYAIKIKAKFKSISLRSEACQGRTHKKLSEILPKAQNTFVLNDCNGTLVGLWFPTYLGRVNVPGFHFHFVDAKRELGGHVFALDLQEGIAQVQVLKSLQMDLIDNARFHEAYLDNLEYEAIHNVEKFRKE